MASNKGCNASPPARNDPAIIMLTEYIGLKRHIQRISYVAKILVSAFMPNHCVKFSAY
jgi:hypothetical protein